MTRHKDQVLLYIYVLRNVWIRIRYRIKQEQRAEYPAKNFICYLVLSFFFTFISKRQMLMDLSKPTDKVRRNIFGSTAEGGTKGKGMSDVMTVLLRRSYLKSTFA
jgi:hypothetical protein